MNHLTAEQIETLRTILVTERAEIETDLEQHGLQEPNGTWDPSSSGLVGEDADPTDAADQIEELVTNVPLVQELSARKRDIDDALEKIANGSYGVCETVGEDISFDRLMANPAARTCIEHKTETVTL
jgi:RNA polymerase-binding protein DksA